MIDQSPETELTLVCHARTPLVVEPVEDRIAKARACEEGEIVDNVVIRSWPESVRLDDQGVDREVVDDYRRFCRWADHRDVEIQPPFETRTRSSIVDDDGVDVLVTPLLCLSLYRNERLVAVYPHSNDDETYTVEAALQRLREDQLPRPLERTGRSAADPRWCPDCDAELLNGQGLFRCPDCAWTGIVDGGAWKPLEHVDPDSRTVSDAPEGSSRRSPTATELDVTVEAQPR